MKTFDLSLCQVPLNVCCNAQVPSLHLRFSTLLGIFQGEKWTLCCSERMRLRLKSKRRRTPFFLSRSPLSDTAQVSFSQEVVYVKNKHTKSNSGSEPNKYWQSSEVNCLQNWTGEPGLRSGWCARSTWSQVLHTGSSSLLWGTWVQVPALFPTPASC